jgi:hypothetical protein
MGRFDLHSKGIHIAGFLEIYLSTGKGRAETLARNVSEMDL